MGTLHVLTGPDHLSAIATLSSADLSYRTKRHDNDAQSTPRNCDFRAFSLGIRWGIGHSVGLILVGGILIGIQEGTTSGEWIGLNTWVSSMLETFVGVFMIGLGSYGAIKAMTNRGHFDNKRKSHTKKKMRRRSSRSSSSHSSSAPTLPADNKATIKSRGSVKNSLVVTGSTDLDLPPHGGRDSILDKMSSALNDRGNHVGDLWNNNDDSDRLSTDADRMLWNAAKSFTDHLTMYASDDDLSCGKSRSESVVTIPMSTLMMDDLHKLYDDTNESFDTSDGYLNRVCNDNSGDLDDDDGTHHDTEHMEFSIPTDFGDGIESSDAGHMERRFRGRTLICTPSSLALLTGIVHGMAGPGGVLGIIPAVEMQDVVLASTYLGIFCITSTLAMGGFAAFYGRMCYWLADGNEKDRGARMNRIFLVEFGSSCLSIIVGVVWLTLLAVGELNEVFP